MPDGDCQRTALAWGAPDDLRHWYRYADARRSPAIATIAPNSRDIQFDYYFSDFYQAGVQEIDATLVGDVSDYVSVPSGVELNQGGLNPGPQTVAEIKANPHFMISRRADPGQGLSPDDGVWAAWNMDFVPEYPPPWVESNPLAE